MLRSLGKLAWLFAVLGGLCAAAVALMVAASIIGRSAFARPIPGDVELTQFGVALCLSLCLPWCQLHGNNIIVDFFTQQAAPRTVRLLDAFGGLLLAAMVLLLAWRTGVGAHSVWQVHEATMILDLPMWWTYAMLAPGLALTGVIALAQAGLRFAGHDPMKANP